jgi:hypothetical protein
MNNEQLEAFMRTSKKLLEAYRWCEKRVRFMKNRYIFRMQDSDPFASRLPPSHNWSFLALEGNSLMKR